MNLSERADRMRRLEEELALIAVWELRFGAEPGAVSDRLVGVRARQLRRAEILTELRLLQQHSARKSNPIRNC